MPIGVIYFYVSYWCLIFKGNPTQPHRIYLPLCALYQVLYGTSLNIFFWPHIRFCVPDYWAQDQEFEGFLALQWFCVMPNLGVAVAD